MSEFLKNQVEARNKVWHEAKALLETADAEKRDLTAAEQETYNKLNAELDQRSEFIANARALAEREERAAAVAQDFEIATGKSFDDADLMRSIARGEVRGHEFRALTGTSGSGVVPTSFYNRVISALLGQNPIFSTSTVINTEGGNTLQIPTLTAYGTNTIKGQGTALDESDPTLSNINLGAFKFGSLVTLSNELIADAGVDVLGLIADAASRKIAYDAGSALTVGTGTVTATGIVTAAASAVTGSTGVAGAPSYENLVDLAYSVVGNNRAGYGWMMNNTGLAAVRKIKDGAGNYIFAPAISVDGRDLLLGQQVFENPAVPSVAVGAKSIVYGKLDDYIVRQAGGIQVATSTDFAFDTDQTVFRVTWRGDGNLAAADSVKYFKGGAS